MRSKIASHPLLSVLVVLLLVGCSIALADVVQLNYTTLRGTCPAIQSTAISAVQTSTFSATPLNPLPTRGNPHVTADVSFDTASATCVLQLGLYFKNADGTYTFLGVSKSVTQTAAGLVNDSGARCHSLALPDFDTAGAPYYDLRVTTISAGNVTVRPWVYGSEAQ